MLSWHNCTSGIIRVRVVHISWSCARPTITCEPTSTSYHSISSRLPFRLLGLFAFVLYIYIYIFLIFSVLFSSLLLHFLSVEHYIIPPGSKGWLHPHHPVITLLTYSQYNFMPHAEKETMAQPTINGEKAHSQFLDVSRLLLFHPSLVNRTRD